LTGVYSKRLAGISNQSGTAGVFVVPAGHIWVAKSMTAVTRSHTANDAFYVQWPAPFIVWGLVTAAAGFYIAWTWTGMAVANAGESCYLAPSAGTWDIQVSGYDLIA